MTRTLRTLVTRTLSTLAAMTLAVTCASIVSPPPAQAAEYGQTPGTYLYLKFPTANVSNMTFTQTVNKMPGNANVYWSNQFSLTNNTTGYMGMQTLRGNRGLFLVSLWGSTEAKAGSEGTWCQDFSEDGTGKSCRSNLRPVEGHRYIMSMTSAADGWWTFVVKDATAGSQFTLGSIKLAPGVQIKTSSVTSWTEYFDWNNPSARCGDEPYSKITNEAPYAQVGKETVTGTWGGSKTSATCADQSRITNNSSSAVQENGYGNSLAGPLVNTSTRQCLSAKGATDATCNVSDSSQTWVLARDKTLHAGWKCLTADKATKSLSMATCTAGDNQQWILHSGVLTNNASGVKLSGYDARALGL